jgi:RHS repeat-associated protein
MKTVTLCLACVLLLVLTALPAARAATGVSEERVSLPEGPGSLEGIGENVEVNASMGAMSHRVTVDVPKGFAGLTPDVSLSYGSSSASSVVGMGWTIPQPSIERLTVRGLPTYGLDDEVSVDGGAELVYVGGTSPRTYRARFEKDFVRYRWHDAGDGAEGWWTAESPDGRVSYYGADQHGTLVATARVGAERGTFRWHLVETTDRYGHVLRYTWTKDGAVALLDRAAWVFTDGTHAEYEAVLAYEDRGDRLSDCRGGFEALLSKRLASILVFAHGTRLRSYELSYEDYATSGGFSRLAGVQQVGADNGLYPAHHRFEYSRALGVDCAAGQDCQQPYVVGMGALGVDMAKGQTTLIDIDGDALPDVLNTSDAEAVHRFFPNVLGADGSHAFGAAVPSAVGTSADLLSSPYVQVLDVNGDGFTDLVNSQTGQVLVNRGAGDWAEATTLWEGDGGLPDLGAEGALVSVKFLDYDGDKRIDLLLSRHDGDLNETLAFHNLAEGGFLHDPNASPVGVGFESPSVELNDMNGDSLLDVVQVTTDGLRYRLNLGWAQWSDWHVVEGFSFTDQEAVEAELEDLNGDGLADLSLVAGTTVRYWLNRNGEAFDPERAVTSADVTGDLPERKLGTTVLYADMNGNGSSDVVWVQGEESGAVYYLELFPVRPNLLARITNGLGRVTDVTYATSVEERARDAATAPWTHPLPNPMTVVSRVDEWDTSSQVHTVTDYAYHDGYFDGVEKRFRGYAGVDRSLAGDELQEAGLTHQEYDVGADDPYRAGLLLSEAQTSGGRLVQATDTGYADCPVADVPTDGLRFPVRSVCAVHEETTHAEGAPEASWATISTAWERDGYGNVTLESRRGVTAVGGGACAACEGAGYAGTPCGPQCLGDEAYTRTEYAVPADNADRWILGRPSRVRTFGVADGEGLPATVTYTDTRTYYDGEAFAGLPAGQVTHGGIARVTERVDTADRTRTRVRNRLDAHGNVVEALDPLGEPGGDTHRRLYQMDVDGLRVVRVDALNADAAGAYSLREDVQYDPAWDQPVAATTWHVEADGQDADTPGTTYYTYDEFGRVTSMIRPGDPAEAPSEEYDYLLGEPVSRVVIRMRSSTGQPADLETVRCLDGRGRLIQERTRLDGDTYRVTGFTTYDLQGLPRREWDPYEATGAACDAAAPAGVRSKTTRHDALGRVVQVDWPSAADGTPMTERTVYGPLETATYDVEDTLAGGPHHDTPTVAKRNGLGQTIAVLRQDAPGAVPAVTTLRYDELGRAAGTVDPLGIARRQENDLLGNPVQIDDPDRGEMALEYDDAGSVVRVTDARGVTLHREWDGLSRPLAEYAEADPAGTRVDWTYDRLASCAPVQCSNLAGQLAAVRYPLGGGAAEERYGYTDRGHVRSLVRSLGGREFAFETLYDDAERVIGNVYPTGRTVQVTMDGADRVVAVPGAIDAVTRDERGLLASLAFSNGTTSAFEHDAWKRLASLQTAGPGGAVVQALTFERDRAGHVVAIADHASAANGPSAAATYGYDALYRLISADLDADDPAHAETLTIAYDAGDRVISKGSSLGAASPAHVGAYTYGTDSAPHAPVQAGALSLGYDPAGRLTSRGDLDLTWDHAGRLVRSAVNGAVVTYGYGARDDRLVREEDGHRTLLLAPDFEVRDGTAVTYVLLDEDRYARIDEPAFAAEALSDLAPATGDDDALHAAPDHAITAADAWLAQGCREGLLAMADGGPDADAPLVLLNASAERTLHGQEPRFTWLHPDHNGNATVTTDASGAVVGRAAYYPFGEVRAGSGAAIAHGFSGKERDAQTGLLDFGARSLDPVTACWTAPDPAFALQEDPETTDAAEATAPYTFVGNDPVNGRDPDGHARVGTVSSFLGRLKTAIALHRGTFRPTVEYHFIFGTRPGDKIGWKTAWRMVKHAGQAKATGTGRTSQAFVRRGIGATHWDVFSETAQASRSLSALTLNKSYFMQSVAPQLLEISKGLTSFGYTREALLSHVSEHFDNGKQEMRFEQNETMRKFGNTEFRNEGKILADKFEARWGETYIQAGKNEAPWGEGPAKTTTKTDTKK